MKDQLLWQKNPEFHKRSKHIDNRYHYIRQLLADNLISIQHVPTKEMVADILVEAWKLVRMCGLSHVRNESCAGAHGRTVRSDNCI
jgi:hypothetical protein